MVTKTPDGGRKPRVTDDELLDVFRSTDDPVLSTAEVADAVPIKRRGTLTRLQSLEDDGQLDSKPIGGRNTVWWIADARDADTTQPPRDGRESVETPPKPKPDELDDDGDGTPAGIDAVVETVAADWGDTGDRLEARKEAARAVLEYAHQHGSISKQEAQQEVEPHHPVSNQDKRTWYRNTANPALKEAGEYDPGTHGYRITLDGGGE